MRKIRISPESHVRRVLIFFAGYARISGSKTSAIKDDPYWTSRKNNLELIKVSKIVNVSLVGNLCQTRKQSETQDVDRTCDL
jgi:hypothetical protein